MIKVGIGGWTYEPWRGLFFPEKLPKTKELYHASRHVTSIEVNGTFYSTFTPTTFKRWADETPDDFIFSLKAPRFAVNRKVLAEAGPSINKSFESGVAELKTKLGPICGNCHRSKNMMQMTLRRSLHSCQKALTA